MSVTEKQGYRNPSILWLSVLNFVVDASLATQSAISAATKTAALYGYPSFAPEEEGGITNDETAVLYD